MTTFVFEERGNILYVPSHIQDSTYHKLCYTSCRALGGIKKCSRKSTTLLCGDFNALSVKLLVG